MSREEILKNIAGNKPRGKYKLPEIALFEKETDAFEDFKKILPKASARFEVVKDYKHVSQAIVKHFKKDIRLVNAVKEIDLEGIDPKMISDLKELNGLDLAIVSGELAVAENGAIWVSDKALPYRILPFICEDLVIVIEKDQIVQNMHQAYAAQNAIDYSYGVFISGPSKTADIEQSLVIGAQGPRNLLVIIIE